MRKLTPKPKARVFQRFVAPAIAGTALVVSGVACEPDYVGLPAEPDPPDAGGEPEPEVVGVPTTDDPPAPEFPDEPGDGGTVDGGTVDG